MSQLDLTPYAGFWIALVAGRVAGVGETAEAAGLAAHRSRPRERIEALFQVAAKPDNQLPPMTTLDLRAINDNFTRKALRRIETLVQPLVLVGGSVRDLMLGRPLHDLDLTVAADGVETARRIANALDGAFLALDTERGTGRVVLNSPNGETLVVDVATWRGADLAEDLAARDFSINALAAVVEGDVARVMDVTGGLADLHAHRLRAASQRAFADDPLRCLRGVRILAELAAWNFRLEPDSAELITRYAPHLADVANERIRDELHRTLNAPQPKISLQRWAELGLLVETLPEAAALQGVTQSPPHIYDVFDHTGYVLEYLAWLSDWIFGQAEPADALDAAVAGVLAPQRSSLVEHLSQGLTRTDIRREMLPWMALCHDWGKPATRTLETVADGGPPRIRFFSHETVSAQLAGGALQRLRFAEAQITLTTTVVSGHMRPHHLTAVGDLPSRRAAFRFFRDLGAAGVETLLLSIADLHATEGPAMDTARWQHHLAVVNTLLEAYFEHADDVLHPVPLLSGHDIMAATGLRPGPQIGSLLALLTEAQAVGEVQNHAQALALIEQSMIAL